MIKELRISYDDKVYIQTELEVNKPYEACGVLIGTVDKDIANVEKIQSITNIRKSSASFELEPMEFYNIWSASEKEGKDVIAIYHTHPFYPAIPSSWDRTIMQNNSFVWLIAGTDGIKSYIWNNGIKFVETIEISDLTGV